MIGYHLAYCESLCGMAMTQGTQRKVINIGIGVRRIEVEPRGITPRVYVESVSHKVRDSAVSFGTAVLSISFLCLAYTERVRAYTQTREH